MSNFTTNCSKKFHWCFTTATCGHAMLYESLLVVKLPGNKLYTSPQPITSPVEMLGCGLATHGLAVQFVYCWQDNKQTFVQQTMVAPPGERVAQLIIEHVV
jgi:hypothetical protein